MNNPPKILLDKNLSDDQSLLFMLKENGYEVLLNNNNENLKNIIFDLNPDIVLLDVVESELQSEVIKDHKELDLPIIFVTSGDTQDILDRLDLNGINSDIVIKPFKFNEILLRIQTHLKIKEIIEQKMVLQKELQLTQKTISIATLAGAIAHDINNLIGAIMGYSDLLKISMDEKKSLDYAERIIEASQKVSELTNNLLSYSKSVRSNPTEVNVKELLEKVLLFHGESNFKKLNYNLQIPDEFPKIYIDKNQIFWAISGIFSNVRELTAENGTISISAQIGEAPQKNKFKRLDSHTTEYVIITIASSESYIDEVTAQKLNEIFEMNTIDYNYELTLSASINIIKKNKGFFWIDTNSGAETRFLIYLPKIPS